MEEKEEKKVHNIEDKRAEKMVALTNHQIASIPQNQAVNKLMTSTDIPASGKMKIYQFFMRIMDSPEAKAALQIVEEINADYVKNNPEADPLFFRDPIFEDIFGDDLLHDSGLKINKLQLKTNDVPEALSIQEMIGLSWLIDFQA